MIRTELTTKALEIATKAHMNQFDKGGNDYIEHPIHVANMMDDEVSTVVALLHDVVEDSDVTFEYLSDFFDSIIINALKLLTHDESVSYMEYIKNIKSNEIATKVKIADIKHNLDESRLINKTDNDKKRIIKYQEALHILLDK